MVLWFSCSVQSISTLFSNGSDKCKPPLKAKWQFIHKNYGHRDMKSLWLWFYQSSKPFLWCWNHNQLLYIGWTGPKHKQIYRFTGVLDPIVTHLFPGWWWTPRWQEAHSPLWCKSAGTTCTCSEAPGHAGPTWWCRVYLYRQSAWAPPLLCH